MPTTEKVCERDGEQTRLTCSQCESPICPKCLVRTPVGMKCQPCGAPARPPRPGRRDRTTLLVPVVVILVGFGVLVLPRLLDRPEDSPNTGARRGPSPEGSVRHARIGMEARDADLAFTVTAFECGAGRVEGGPAARTAQGRFCFMALEVRNNGKGPATFIARSQVLQDAQARQFGPDVAATAAHPANGGRDLLEVVINPGNALAATIVYDIPPDAQPTLATLRAGPQGPGAFVNLEPAS